MAATVTILKDENILEFRIRENVSIINALRRILLSEIPVIGCITFPHANNLCEIKTNTTRFTNEMIKQRISCIPIHIVPGTETIENLEVKCKVQNNEKHIIYVTSKDFKVFNTETNKEVIFTNPIFPPDPISGEYCDLLRLRPKINDTIQGESIDLTFKMVVTNAKHNGCFNAVSKATFKVTEDLSKASVAWKEYSKDKKDLNDIDKQNWYLIEGKKYYIEDSFDFKVETIGVLTNRELIKTACKIMMKKINAFKSLIDENLIEINKSVSTLLNSYDIKLINEDYTLGKVLEYIIYKLHFMGDKTVSYIGFKKYHPHDNYSIIRIALNDTADNQIIIKYLLNAIAELLNIYQIIHDQF